MKLSTADLKRDYEDVRDDPRAHTLKAYDVVFKSCPICDKLPFVGITRGRDRLYYAECFAASHTVRVVAPDAATLAKKWNARSFQNECYKGSNELRVTPFKAVVDVQPIWTEVSKSESAQKLYSGRLRIQIPPDSFLYLDGDKNGGYYMAAWSTNYKRTLYSWNTRLGVYPYYEPKKAKHWF